MIAAASAAIADADEAIPLLWGKEFDVSILKAIVL